MAVLTVSTDPIVPFVDKARTRGILYKVFSGTGTDASTIQAAGDAGTKHIIKCIELDIDTAAISLAIISGTTTIRTLRFPVADTYIWDWPYGLECGDAEALTINKSDGTSTINGTIWYIPNAVEGVIPR